MIKARPEDFIVEEEALLPLAASGEFRIYRLTKTHWNTLDLIHHLAEELELPSSRFSYGGKKDKHGLTSQFITIRDRRDFSRRGKGYVLESGGFMDRPMGPDLIRANAFTVTIRNLVDTALIFQNIEDVGRTGFPNFFDDQRFRSFDPARGFFAEKILHRHWNGALQAFLTSARDDDDRKEKERKEAMFQKWKDWSSCLELAQSRLEKKIFSYLQDHPHNSVEALHFLPAEEISMQYAAFQSHLWNELLRRLIRFKIQELVEVRGKEGPYVFWRKLDGPAEREILSLALPTAAAKIDWKDEFPRSIYEQILKERGLRSGLFRTKALRRVYFRSSLRRAVLIPENLLLGGSEEDELHPGKKKLTLTFSLPRGAYGTMLIKRLTLSKAPPEPHLDPAEDA